LLEGRVKYLGVFVGERKAGRGDFGVFVGECSGDVNMDCLGAGTSKVDGAGGVESI
jgi:hypothetical protein